MEYPEPGTGSQYFLSSLKSPKQLFTSSYESANHPDTHIPMHFLFFKSIINLN